MAADPLPDPVPPLTTAEQAEVTAEYAQLKLGGIAAGREYVMCHTSARFQKAMLALAVADFPDPPDPAPPLAI